MEPRRPVELGPPHIRALLCLAEARRLARHAGAGRGAGQGPGLWPGFDFEAVPVVFWGDGGADPLLLQHPEPPSDFRLLELPIPGLDGVDIYYHQGPVPYLPAVGPVEVAGAVAATLPLSVLRAGLPPEQLVATVVHEVFHAFTVRSGPRRPDLSLFGSYPELSPVNNALGTTEGLILSDYLGSRLGLAGASGAGRAAAGGSAGSAAPGDPAGVAYTFSLVRRERRAPLEDDIIEYEQGLEASEGLARYVEIKSLLAALPNDPVPGSPVYVPGEAFRVLSGRDRYDRAAGLVSERVEKLRDLNVKAAGSAWWRFFYSGMALALLADDLDPEWKRKVIEGYTLDNVVEQGVEFDGASGDERELERVKELYGYGRRLDEEREFSREERKRKEELLARLLQGTGTRITFDVSALIAEDTWLDSGRFTLQWDPAAAETVTKHVRIHRRGLRFTGFGTDLRFTDLPVVEDLKNRLFHVNVPAGRLGVTGDGHPHPPSRPAEFEEGLDVILPGVAAHATRGFVQNAGGTLYIKITC